MIVLLLFITNVGIKCSFKMRSRCWKGKVPCWVGHTSGGWMGSPGRQPSLQLGLIPHIWVSLVCEVWLQWCVRPNLSSPKDHVFSSWASLHANSTTGIRKVARAVSLLLSSHLLTFYSCICIVWFPQLGQIQRTAFLVPRPGLAHDTRSVSTYGNKEWMNDGWLSTSVPYRL